MRKKETCCINIRPGELCNTELYITEMYTAFETKLRKNKELRFSHSFQP